MSRRKKEHRFRILKGRRRKKRKSGKMKSRNKQKERGKMGMCEKSSPFLRTISQKGRKRLMVKVDRLDIKPLKKVGLGIT